MYEKVLFYSYFLIEHMFWIFVRPRSANMHISIIHDKMGKLTWKTVMLWLRMNDPASILRKSTSGRHRPVSYPDGPMTARYRFT